MLFCVLKGKNMLAVNQLTEKPKNYGYTLSSDCHDTDAEGFLRPSSVLRYLQTAANLQLHHCGPTNEELREHGQAFVLTRIALEFLEPIGAYEELYAQTWGLESRGFSFGRCYRLSKDGKTVARAQSVWALLDIKDKKPLPVKAFDAGFGTDAPFKDPLPLRMRMPQDELFCEVGQHRVSYAETDVNRHMNNTCYPDMLVDYLPKAGNRVRSMTVNFCREAPSGECLTVHRAESDGKYFFRTYRQDGLVNIEASVELVPLS